MNAQIKRYVFWVVTSFLSIFLLFLNFQFPSFVEKIYQKKNFVLLNQFVDHDINETLGYYVGQVDNIYVGPVTSVITYTLFALFCLLYLKKSSPGVFCCAVFLFLILTKFNVLFYPPYGDAIGGPFAEALWLAEHHFDYAGLLHQPPYNLGGPRVYFFSIYPTYLAILLKLIPSTKIFFVVNHLFVYGMAALIITLIKNIVAMKFNQCIAILSSVILLALPLFQSQTEAINMEIPCLLFSILSIYYLVQKRIGLALVMAVWSLLVKGHGIIPCGTVACVSIILFLFDSCKEEPLSLKGSKRLLMYSFLAVMSIVLMAGSKFLLKDQHATGGMMGFLNGLPSLKIMYLPRLYGMSFVLFFCLVLWEEGMGRRKLIPMPCASFWGINLNKNFDCTKNFYPKGTRGALVSILVEKYYPQCVVFVCAGMWFILFLNYTEVSPRYKLALAPYLILCLVFAVLSIPRLKRIMPFILMAGVSMTALGSYGFYHHPVIPNYHIFSERSLEYRNDLKLNRRLVKMIEDEYSTMTIGAPFLIAQILAIPQLGYVKEPLRVMAYGMPIKYGGIKNFEGLKKEDILETLWVGVAAQFEKRGVFQYPVHEKDRVIKELAVGENRVTLFMGGFAIEQKRAIIYAFQKRRKK